MVDLQDADLVRDAVGSLLHLALIREGSTRLRPAGVGAAEAGHLPLARGGGVRGPPHLLRHGLEALPVVLAHLAGVDCSRFMDLVEEHTGDAVALVRPLRQRADQPAGVRVPGEDDTLVVRQLGR